MNNVFRYKYNPIKKSIIKLYIIFKGSENVSFAFENGLNKGQLRFGNIKTYLAKYSTFQKHLLYL